jgi:hypothetical protein
MKKNNAVPDIHYGNRVKNREGKQVGKVSLVIRDSWTGEISSIRISTEQGKHVFLSPEDLSRAPDGMLVQK